MTRTEDKPVTKLCYAEDLASDLGYSQACPKFWRWCHKVGLRTLPGKPMAFDRSEVLEVLFSEGIHHGGP